MGGVRCQKRREIVDALPVMRKPRNGRSGPMGRHSRNVIVISAWSEAALNCKKEWKRAIWDYTSHYGKARARLICRAALGLIMPRQRLYSRPFLICNKVHLLIFRNGILHLQNLFPFLFCPPRILFFRQIGENHILDMLDNESARRIREIREAWFARLLAL